MGALNIPRISVEEYLESERRAETPSEYYDGVVVPLASAVSWGHGLVVLNFGASLVTRLRGGPCRLSSGAMVRVSPTKYFIPDIAVICGEPAFGDGRKQSVSNPKVVIEILSPSTEGRDFGVKSVWYRRMPSIEEYVLVFQDQPRIDVIRRSVEGHTILTFDDPSGAVELRSLSLTIPLAEIYDGIEFTEES